MAEIAAAAGEWKQNEAKAGVVGSETVYEVEAVAKVIAKL